MHETRTPDALGSTGAQTATNDKPSSSSNRKPKSPGKTPRKIATPRSKSQKSNTELRLQAIQVLTNLDADGRFFLVYADTDGQTDTITHWS